MFIVMIRKREIKLSPLALFWIKVRKSVKTSDEVATLAQQNQDVVRSFVRHVTKPVIEEIAANSSGRRKSFSNVTSNQLSF